MDSGSGYTRPVTIPPRTRTDEVYDALRSELLNGTLLPGQKLRMVELGGRFGVSQSVVREALTRLGEQRLVVASPQRGFRVRDLSVRDIAELTEARVRIEPVALRLAIERGDIRWETGILTTYHVLEHTPVLDEQQAFNEDWALRHRDYHRALLAGCENGHLEEIAQSLRDCAELYRRWYWALTDDHHRDVAAEHRRLKELCLGRDADAASAVLTEHIERAPRELIAYARAQGVDALSQPA
jgi:DNA-binding GntR family transcriptional regulator